VGIGTLLADNPQLTVRLVEGRQPQPVVLDSRLRTPPDARLFSGPCNPWIAALEPLPSSKQAALERAGARLLSFDPGPDGRIPLPALLECLAGQGVNSLMVEGGAEVLAAFLAQRLADQAIITIAPLFVGGLHALSPDIPLSPFPRLHDYNCERLGEDLIIWGKIG
jgi:3,4-dihydroxy 2-butanone 4-phosphate synthase/GTP cyclohydrolase II